MSVSICPAVGWWAVYRDPYEPAYLDEPLAFRVIFWESEDGDRIGVVDDGAGKLIRDSTLFGDEHGDLFWGYCYDLDAYNDPDIERTPAHPVFTRVEADR